MSSALIWKRPCEAAEKRRSLGSSTIVESRPPIRAAIQRAGTILRAGKVALSARSIRLPKSVRPQGSLDVARVEDAGYPTDAGH